ncbi:MAG: flavodoxin family protein [Actinobacteria bacterium]|nr:MAG: flavodoxin family protein [Actinomycetota bacterium]
MKKRVLVILGHPNKDSFNGDIARAYAEGAKEGGAEVKLLYLDDLEFDPILHKGYETIQQLEPNLLLAQDDIRWCDHLVWVYPTWWGSPPALMKGFIERAFHPSFAFKYKRKKDFFPVQLLKGRSARLIVTMDDFRLADFIIFYHSVIRVMKWSVLLLSGIRPVRSTIFSSVKRSSKIKREKWLNKVRRLGQKLR